MKDGIINYEKLDISCNIIQGEFELIGKRFKN